MKIGIIGNMNNTYFSLARYLRDEGYDCELLVLTNEPLHFDPACDTHTTDYKEFCHYVSWGEPGKFLKDNLDEVKKDLAPYTFLIGNGAAPAYVARIGRHLDVFIPYGYDIYSLPFFRLVHPVRQLAYLATRLYQRRGIRQCTAVLFDRTNAAFEKRIQRLKISGKRIVAPLPMLYHKDYERGWQERIHNPVLSATLKKLRGENQLLLVQQCRQLWKHSPDPWSHKGNHLLIEGYSRFVNKHSAVRSKLLLFEYGTDVDETKKLVVDLQLEDWVVWMPQMNRTELMQVVATADLVVGELHHSWLTYGVMMEALCLGKAFMHKRIEEEYLSDYPRLYPMINAGSAEDVYNGIQKVAVDTDRLKAIGLEGKNWFLTYCVQRPINELKKLIDAKIQCQRA